MTMRFLKKALRRTLERTLHLRIDSTRPHGRDDCNDIAASGASIETIVDVGANDGSSALKFHEAFPHAVIHALEPVSATFAKLTQNTAPFPQIRCHRLAAGEAPGQTTIYLTEHSTMSSLIRPDDVRGEEIIEVTTLDLFAASQRLDSIDLLKIDAEGYDLHVIRGATGLLARNAVKFILVELGFHPDDPRHVLFDHVRDALLPHRFRVYGFYDQQLEWSGENRLRYANVCFVHESVSRTRG